MNTFEEWTWGSVDVWHSLVAPGELEHGLEAGGALGCLSELVPGVPIFLGQGWHRGHQTLGDLLRRPLCRAGLVAFPV